MFKYLFKNKMFSIFFQRTSTFERRSHLQNVQSSSKRSRRIDRRSGTGNTGKSGKDPTGKRVSVENNSWNFEQELRRWGEDVHGTQSQIEESFDADARLSGLKKCFNFEGVQILGKSKGQSKMILHNCHYILVEPSKIH